MRLLVTSPLTNIITETVSKRFIQNWVTIYGKLITSTGDWKFSSLAKYLEACRIGFTQHYHQFSRLMERPNCQLKAALV